MEEANVARCHKWLRLPASDIYVAENEPHDEIESGCPAYAKETPLENVSGDKGNCQKDDRGKPKGKEKHRWHLDPNSVKHDRLRLQVEVDSDSDDPVGCDTELSHSLVLAKQTGKDVFSEK